MKRKPVASVDAWIAAEAGKPRRGSCYGCGCTQRKRVEADALRFIAKRNAGKTALTWNAFVIGWVKPQYEYVGDPIGLRNHMERCCGKKIRQ